MISNRPEDVTDFLNLIFRVGRWIYHLESPQDRELQVERFFAGLSAGVQGPFTALFARAELIIPYKDAEVGLLNIMVMRNLWRIAMITKSPNGRLGILSSSTCLDDYIATFLTCDSIWRFLFGRCTREGPFTVKPTLIPDTHSSIWKPKENIYAPLSDSWDSPKLVEKLWVRNSSHNRLVIHANPYPVLDRTCHL